MQPHIASCGGWVTTISMYGIRHIIVMDAHYVQPILLPVRVGLLLCMVLGIS